MRVLMMGVTGEFGSLVVPELKKRGVTVRALVHVADKEEAARKQGADEVAVGDLQQPETLERAARGADAVFHLNPAFAPREGDLGVNMVQAAQAACVAKFVFSGVLHPSISKLSNHREKLEVEEALYESGLNFTVLQPTMFMQNMTSAWPQIVKTGRFALPYSKLPRASYVDYRDVAEAAAIALTTDKLDFGTFELCAPGMFNRVELAALMSKALHRQIEPGEVPFEQWADTAKIPNGPVREGLQRMYAYYDQYGLPAGNDLVLRSILGRDPRTLMQFFQELAAQPGAPTS